MFVFCDQCFICKSCDLHGSVVDDPVLLEYDPVSLGYRVPKFRRNILSRKVGTRLPSDASYPIRGPRIFNIIIIIIIIDRLCGLVVRVSGYRYRGPGFDPRRYQIF